MSQYFRIHPDNPQQRLVGQAAAILRQGGVIAYPTDSCYALGCLAGDKSAVQRIIRIRELPPDHLFTILCGDLSGIGTLARIDNTAFRLIKAHVPGPYTFVLKATREVPKNLQHRRRTIGLRVPDNRICQALLDALGEPLLSTSLILPGRDAPESDPQEIRERIGRQLDLVIDGGAIGTDMTTIIDLSGDSPEIIRQGKGAVEAI